MSIVLLSDLKMEIDSHSYMDALHGVLTHKGWISCPKFMLSGMTVAGFRFSVHRRLTAESPTAYNWMAENFLAVDFLGITSLQDAGYNFNATFPLYQKQAICDIKQSIDRGIGAVIWQDKFSIVAGYDDQQEVLYISDGEMDGYKMLPYKSFGHNRSPYWYYQCFEGQTSLDKIEIYKESFVQAIYKWEQHDPMLPEAEYACGRAAYEAIVNALRYGNYDQNSVRYVIQCYTASKKDIYLYMTELERIWPQISKATAQYKKIARNFENALTTLDVADGGKQIEPHHVETLIELFQDAQQSEEQAMDSLKQFMRETIDNRFDDIALR